MDGFDKFVHGKEPAPYEKIIVNPIEKDKKTKEEPYTGLKDSTRSQVFATLASYLKKMISSFNPKGKEQIYFLDQQQLIDHVLSFRKLLQILCLEDQSHNPEFTQQLSEIWHNLLDNTNALSYTTGERLPSLLSKITFFVKQVHHYPPSADHTLGYYFTEYAGKEWIPFPFMELLQDLHEEFNHSPQNSVLHNWISLLDEILSQAGVKTEDSDS